MRHSTYCDLCQAERDSAPFEFIRHQGMVAVFWQRKYRGYFCRRCASRVFWHATLPTLLFGWFGVLSMFVAPWAVVMNALSLRSVRGLRHYPRDVEPEEVLVDAESLTKLHPWLRRIDHDLTKVEPDRHVVARQVAEAGGPQAAITLKYLDDIEEQESSRGNERHQLRGFEPIIRRADADSHRSSDTRH